MTKRSFIKVSDRNFPLAPVNPDIQMPSCLASTFSAAGRAIAKNAPLVLFTVVVALGALLGGIALGTMETDVNLLLVDDSKLPRVTRSHDSPCGTPVSGLIVAAFPLPATRSAHPIGAAHLAPT